MSKREREQAQQDAERALESERKANLRKLIKRGPTACAYVKYLDVWATPFTNCDACGHNGSTHVYGPCPLCQFEIRLRKLEEEAP